MQASCGINMMKRYANFANIGARTMKFGSFNGGDDDENKGAGLMNIFEMSKKIVD